LTALVADRLKASITDGTIKPGTMLNEKQIAEEFGTSKTPVREAFVQLQAIGLLDIRPQRGGVVFHADETQVRELCEVRRELETVALRLALERNQKGLATLMSSIVEDMKGSFNLERPMPYLIHDDNFHLSFFASAGNSLLLQAYEQFAPRIRALRTHLSAPQSLALKISLGDHKAMLELVKANDFESAARILNEHIARVEEFQLIQLRENAASLEAPGEAPKKRFARVSTDAAG
jgi:DNA-binding GntR family transcriptional regulator